MDALHYFPDHRALEPLCKFTDSRAFAGFIEEAIRCLGQLGDERALPTLVGVLLDTEGCFDRDAGAMALAPLFHAAKMGFLPETSPMLDRFRREYATHGEYLLAPVVKAPDGKLYVEVELGIIKTRIHFLTVADIEAALIELRHAHQSHPAADVPWSTPGTSGRRGSTSAG